MKKCLAVFLTATLLLTALVIQSSAASNSNSNVKEILSLGYDTEEEVNTAVKSAICTASYSSEIKNGGAGSLKVAHEQTDAWFGLGTNVMKAGKRYCVTMDILVESIETSKVLDLKFGSAPDLWQVHGVTPPYCYSIYFSQPATWKTYTFEFTAQKNGALQTYFYCGATFYIDNLTITEVTSPTTLNFYAGDTQIEQLKGLYGSVLNLPTPKKEGYTFEGWYKEKTFENKFTATTFPAENTTLYAKFLFTSGYDFNDITDISTLGNVSTEAFSVGNDTSISRDGTTYLAVEPDSNCTGTKVCSFPSVELKRGKIYQISYWFKKGEKSVANTTSTDSTFRLFESKHQNAHAEPWGNSRDIDCLVINENVYTGWYQRTVIFTAGNTNEGYGETCYLAAKLTGMCYNLYIDDIVVQEITPKTELETAVEQQMNYKGVSVRPTVDELANGKIAIRFKSSISKSLIQNGVTLEDGSHYTVTEYGHAYFKEELLNGAELDLSQTYSSKTPKTAVAYNKADGTDIYFAKTNTEVTYTVALVGFTEEQFTTGYVARPYVKLQKDGETDTVTVYGTTTQYASLAEVADLAFYAQVGDFGIPENATAHPDTEGNQWYETYTIREDLYNNVLSKLKNTTYFYYAPLAENNKKGTVDFHEKV